MSESWIATIEKRFSRASQNNHPGLSLTFGFTADFFVCPFSHA